MATLQRSTEAIHRAVALPIDQILIDAVRVLDTYQGGDPRSSSPCGTSCAGSGISGRRSTKSAEGWPPARRFPRPDRRRRRELETVRVLVADSDAQILESAHSILERHDCTVETARTGEQALSMVRTSLRDRSLSGHHFGHPPAGHERPQAVRSIEGDPGRAESRWC